METLQQAVIVNAKEEVLLIMCGKSFGKELSGKWEFPNVFLEDEGSFDENLKNGVKEITGIDVDIIYQFFTGIVKEEDAEFLNVGFLCRLKDQKAKIKLHEDYAEAKWVKPKEIKKLKTTNVQVIEMAEKALVVLQGGGSSEE